MSLKRTIVLVLMTAMPAVAASAQPIRASSRAAKAAPPAAPSWWQRAVSLAGAGGCILDPNGILGIGICIPDPLALPLGPPTGTVEGGAILDPNGRRRR